MRILIFHGYLLRGTGSNIYNANLVRTLAALGHEVHLLCQDRDCGAARGRDGAHPGHRAGAAGLRGGRLRGLRRQALPELTDAELEHYIAANVEAVRAVPTRPTWRSPTTS